MLATAHTNTLTETLREAFGEHVDGYWYPLGSDEPLVRIYVGGDGYQVERRRNLRAPWMVIVTAQVAEFDPHAFRTWCGSWPLTA